tara:strand:+ start:938 stop:1888 length:951 start_codon:yes stop_codon:yes gene_type:complete
MIFLKKLTNSFSPELNGGLLIVLAMTIIGPNDTIIPFIAEESGLWQFHFSRSLIAVLVLLFCLYIMGVKLKILSLSSILIRTLFFTLSMIIYFGSLGFIPIAITGAGMFTAPIFVLIFSSILYKESLDRNKIFAVLLGSIGVWIILDPSSNKFQILNLFPILGGIFLAMGNIATRKICSNENPFILLIFFFIFIGSIGVIAASALSILEYSGKQYFHETFIMIGWRNVSFYFWVLVFIQAIGAIVGISLITIAYQRADTGYLNIFEYSFFIFAGLSGWLILNQVLNLKTMFGILLIILSGIVASIGSQRKYNLNNK